MFLHHRWVLVGAIRNDPSQEADQLRYPCLEIIDPTSCTWATTLELNKGMVEYTSTRSTIDISIGSSATHEEGFLRGSGGMPFVPDTSRGIITADVKIHNDCGAALPVVSYYWDYQNTHSSSGW